MKAALLEAVGLLRIVETEPPVIEDPNDLLIEVDATGICGSEVHAFKGTHPFRKPPSIMGHEISGRVLEVGPDVRGLARGRPRRRRALSNLWTLPMVCRRRAAALSVPDRLGHPGMAR